MSDSGWKYSALQGIGTRIEVMAELYPRTYLLLTAFIAVTGYGCLLLFPLLVLASVAGVYQSLTGAQEVAWLQLLFWMPCAGVCGLVSYRIFQFRPSLPAGTVLHRGQAPALFQLVDDTLEHYAGPGIDRIVMTGTYQLDVVSTPRAALSPRLMHSLVIGLPLMQCLSTTRFSCLLARRLGQFSRRTNPLLNWLYQLREVWPRYQVPAPGADSALLPVHRLFSFYAPLYTAVSTAAARLDELQADSYAMELFSDEEVLDAITSDAVYRLFLRERYWPAIRKLRARDAAAISATHAGMVTVLHAGVQDHNVAPWIEQARSMEQYWDDPWPLLTRRLENIGHAHANMDTCPGESAAVDYLETFRPHLESVPGGVPEPAPEPAPLRVRPWSLHMAGLHRRALSIQQGLLHRLKNTPHPN